MSDETQGATSVRSSWLVSMWALVHPGPSLVTALAYAGFATLAARGRPDPGKLAITLAGMIALQFAISAFNDYRDRKADRLSHKFKPLALGLLSPRVALIATAFYTAIMVACYAPYGREPLLIAAAFLLLGFAYDLGLKSTPLGAVTMGLAFPLLPLLAWDLFATVHSALYWTFPIGLAIGASIHIADAAPDTTADRAAGAHGLTQALGQYALGVGWALLAAAAVLIILLAQGGVTPARPIVLAISTPVALGLLIFAIAYYQRARRSLSQRLRANFVLTVVIALVIAAGWVASGLT